MHYRHLARVLTLAVFLSLLNGSGLAQTPLGELAGADASVKGSVVLAGGDPRVMSGSTISAGQDDATLKLLRGGALNVCRGTSVSLTGSASGQQIMVGLSSGIIETNYSVAASGDMVMTPDFQIQLRGAGLFHFAISADEHGNTCVQALPGNTGSIRVSELMGDGVYDVGPSDQVFFRSGKASTPGPVVGNCGCPAPPKVLIAEAKTPQPPAPVPPPSEAVTQLAQVPIPAPSLAAAALAPPPPATPPPSVSDVHIEVDAPFVFRATEPMPIPDPPYNIARIQLSALPVLPATAALPPEVKQAKAVPQTATVKPRRKRKGLFAFLASIFGG